VVVGIAVVGTAVVGTAAAPRLIYRLMQNEISQTKIAASQKCLNILAPNFAHLFGTILYTNILLSAVFS